MKGVYVPFWIFDVDAEGSVAYNGERITKWRNGDTEYTKTEMYSMQRGGNLSFARVPADGSRKMDDTLMESIEPFEFREAVPFQAAYLAGYMADRYDMDMEERMERARERVKKGYRRCISENPASYGPCDGDQQQCKCMQCQILVCAVSGMDPEHYLER